MPRRVLGFLLFVVSPFLLAPQVHAEPMDARACADYALKNSPKVEEEAAKVKEYEAKLAEVEAIFYPKLQALAYLAPMFTVKGTALTMDVERRYKKIGDWGPYAHLQAVLAQPLFTFGRAKAGEEAARQRAEVEKARLREAENVIALETKRLYYLRLFALSMLPSLNNAQKIIAEAHEKATEMYEDSTGEVTQADLMKLVYGHSEVKKYIRLAADGASLATEAIKHTIGMPPQDLLSLKDERLRELPEETTLSLANLLQQASEKRPEWQQLEAGRKATLAWTDAEKLANLPVLFLAGQFTADWAPTRDDAKNSYWYDPYNQIFGGVALGLLFDVDPAKSSARSAQAEATGAQVEALRRFASTGIPLQVRKAYDEVQRGRELVKLSEEGAEATKKWMTFAAAAYLSGTGEARDVLEGVAAYLSAKKGYYESLQGYYVACAELDFAVGLH